MREFEASEWVGIQQIFRLERIVVEKGVRRREVIYGVTSLSPKQAGPAELLGAHWAIEIVSIGVATSPQVRIRAKCAPLGLRPFWPPSIVLCSPCRIFSRSLMPKLRCGSILLILNRPLLYCSVASDF